VEKFTLTHRRIKKQWNGNGRHNVFPCAIVSESKNHPTEKPIALMLELVGLFTNPGEVVFDPFAGSGTTGVACLRLGRKFVGIERDDKFRAIAVERMSAEVDGVSVDMARAKQEKLF